MTDPSSVTSFRLTAGRAEERIHEIAKTSGLVKLTLHAKDRMRERDIVVQDVYRILEAGHVLDAPERTQTGDWKCKITMKVPGRRTAGVVAVIVQNGRLVVVTVEWEDGR